MFIETKLVLQAQSRCVPGRPLLDPLYRWPGLEVPVGYYTNSPCYGSLHIISLFEYNICRLLSWTYIPMGLNPNISRGYQCHGSWQAYPCHSSNYNISPLFLPGCHDMVRMVNIITGDTQCRWIPNSYVWWSNKMNVIWALIASIWWGWTLH
jgi:hypothetical protein